MMPGKIKKVKQYEKYPLSPSSPTKRELCICASLKPAIIICRIFGMLPITTNHDENNECVFVKNQKWFIYSIILFVLSLLRAFLTTEILSLLALELYNNKSLHGILSAINDILYAFYVTALVGISIYRYPKFVETLNRIPLIVKETLYCQASRRTVLSIQYGLVLVFALIAVVKFSGIIYVQFNDAYETANFGWSIYMNAIIQCEIFLLYIMFIAISSVVMSMLGCFEKYAIKCLNFKPLHPLTEVDETHNTAEFMGVITYRLCKGIHKAKDDVIKLPLAEIVEYLRSLHEEICVIMYEMNNCLNPQFLVHVVVELTVLVFTWYAVITYMAYVFYAPVAATLYFLNIIFVVIHTLGMLLFLKQAQQLHNLVRALIHLLLEYSTRITSPEEHQQIRIFIEKVKIQRPLSASGVFNIDLGIAGPVCANILTYVMVALQFDVPKT